MVSVFDRGFLYGDGIFETLRVNNGKPFLLDRHIGRLQHGMGTLHIGERYDFGQLVQHATALIAKNNNTANTRVSNTSRKKCPKLELLENSSSLANIVSVVFV